MAGEPVCSAFGFVGGEAGRKKKIKKFAK